MELKMEVQEVRGKKRYMQLEAKQKIIFSWYHARERRDILDYEAKEEISRKWSKVNSEVKNGVMSVKSINSDFA